MAEFELDYVHVHDQLKKMRATVAVEDGVKALAETLNDLALSVDTAREAVEALAELVKGHSLLPSETEEAWAPCIPGMVHTGDVVRVRHDAFSGSTGRIHNGRVGKVLFVRSGDISVRSTDDLDPFLDGARYRAENLEYRVV